jgi:pyrimidine deaminase RibD-like protein
MRTQVGGDPGPEYNLAKAWTHYGVSAGGPSVGTIVVWRHHVGKIVGQQNGQWIVQSGNDGHAVRTRPRSLAGAIAFRRAYASM